MSKSIFLSYARGDDETFVARLHADFTARGFSVWWDVKWQHAVIYGKAIHFGDFCTKPS